MSDVMSGTWFIVRTSLPMWRKRTNPTITYAALPDGRVSDTVMYGAGAGKRKTVVGVDTPQGNGRYAWRGLGFLAIATSDWSVIDAEGDWAVTHFSKTLFSREGMDLYWRQPNPSAAEVEAALDRVRDRPEVKHLVADLFAPQHDSSAATS